MPRPAKRVPAPRAGCALVVFAKAPTPGTVKTRLTPPLTPTQAARLHKALVNDTLARTASLDVARYLACAPTAADPFLRGCARRHRARIMAQGRGDLGARMRRIAERLLHRHEKVLVIGTDSPTMPIAFLHDACRLLEDADLVFGPSEDGGYYLLGLRRLHPAIFTGIDWGTSRVLSTTLDRVPKRLVALLPSWYDVDRPEDLARLHRAVSARRDCPDTRAWFEASAASRL